jgi:hypothetical protein
MISKEAEKDWGGKEREFSDDPTWSPAEEGQWYTAKTDIGVVFAPLGAVAPLTAN